MKRLFFDLLVLSAFHATAQKNMRYFLSMGEQWHFNSDSFGDSSPLPTSVTKWLAIV